MRAQNVDGLALDPRTALSLLLGYAVSASSPLCMLFTLHQVLMLRMIGASVLMLLHRWCI
jgi:hypothetical protein